MPELCGNEKRSRRVVYNLAYYQSHKSELKIYHAAYYLAHKEEKAVYVRAYDLLHKKDDIARRRAIKLAIFNAYGGPKCTCCGETLFEGLTIDHINGNGRNHRRQLGIGGASTYRWLMKNNYPSGFQVLCMTCNFAKRGHEHCPHKDIPQVVSSESS